MTNTNNPAPATSGGDPISSEVKLRDYQKLAVQFISTRKRAGLFLDM